MMQLDIQSQHVLDAVGTENYIRYGVRGPHRYLGSRSAEHAASPTHVRVKLSLEQPQHPPQVIAELVLERKEHVPERYTAWQGESTDVQLHLLWVWDFFRMSSFLHLRLVAEHPEELVSDYQPLLQAPSESTLLLTVDENAGSIRQIHKLKVSSS